MAFSMFNLVKQICLWKHLYNQKNAQMGHKLLTICSQKVFFKPKTIFGHWYAVYSVYTYSVLLCEHDNNNEFILLSMNTLL